MRNRWVMPDWLIIATIVACILGVAALLALTANRLLLEDAATPKAQETTAPSVPAPAKTAAPKPSATPKNQRALPVVVYNNTKITGLARRTGDEAAAIGWKVLETGNWPTAYPENTVFYPSGQKAAAELLADDLGIDRTAPLAAPMKSDRLTVVLTGPQ